MDTFMDKLAQKLNAQEMIKANSAADAEEMSRLKSQVEGYKECLDKVQQLADEGIGKLQQLTDEGIDKLQQIQQDEEARKEIEATIAQLKEDLSKELENINDSTHKECVKVYRNVQAVVTEESKKQVENITATVECLNGKTVAALVISIFSMLGAVGSLVFLILLYLHIL